MRHTRRYLLISLLYLGASWGLSMNAWADSAPEDDSGLPLQELRTFAEIFGRIKSDYVESVDDRELGDQRWGDLGAG